MNGLYSATQVAEMIGVTSKCIKDWEEADHIPKALRLGLKRARMWDIGQLQLILDFAKDNGYPVDNHNLVANYEQKRY